MKEKEINIGQSSLDKEKDKTLKKTVKKIDESASRNEKNYHKKGIFGLPEFTKIGKKFVKTSTLIVSGYVLTGLLIVGAMSWYLAKNVFMVTPEASSLIEINASYVTPKTDKVENLFGKNYDVSVPLVPKTEESPINGVLLTKDELEDINSRLPILVMVNNHSAARPQSNLSKADIVYETLVESGITRYLALYWSNKVEEVGPIRSVRNYHLEFLSGYDGVLIHDGQAYSDDPKVDAAGNIYKYGIKDARTYSAWRTYDDHRRAPHNEYSNPAKVWAYADSKGWDGPPDLESWKFKQDAGLEQRPDKFNAAVEFLNGYGKLYDVEWSYDKIVNRYYREIGGKRDIDQVTNQQIAPKVVIIQEVDFKNTYDYKGHVIVETIGEGHARILQDGAVHNATWKKSSRTDRTTYFSEDGEEFTFNRGQIWIQAVPSKAGDIEFSE